jgi:large repetitive protein
MDSGEVLDFDLFTSDPGSDLTAVPDASAGTMFMQLFQFAGDDLIVILKLQDADDPSITTTKAIIIDAGDLFTDDDVGDPQLDGTPWDAMVTALGSQDALLVIEPNDYNDGNDNWVIVGAQILTDDDLVTGTGLNFNGDLGATGGTDRNGDGVFADVDAPPPGPGGADFDEVQPFSDDTDVSGVKITNIGFLVPSTSDQQVILEFDVTVTDADGDSVTQNDVTVIIGDAPPAPLLATSSSEKGGPAVQEVISTSSLLVSDTQTVERIAANSNSVTLAAAVAAAGVAADFAGFTGPAIGDYSDSFGTHVLIGREAFADLGGTQQSGGLSAVEGLSSGGFDFGALSMASTSHTAIMASSIGELGINLSLGNGPNALLQATDFGATLQMSAPAMAMDVAMPSIESLMPQMGGVDVQSTGSIAQIVADALQGGGSAPSIDALLSSLPGAGLGENAGLHGLATQIGDTVPAWDMGHAGGFTFDVASIITSEAMVLHHDAVQPVANG